jgi:hypothetical protein
VSHIRGRASNARRPVAAAVIAIAPGPRYTPTMRLAAAAVILVLGVGVAAAQPDPGGFAPAPEPTSQMRRPEVLTDRPSGFWTSTRPADGNRYRWRIMAMGGLVLAVSVFFVARAIRRANAGSVRGNGPWEPSPARRRPGS